MIYDYIRLIVLSFFFVLGSISSQAAAYFEYTDDAKQAYDLALSLRFEEAKTLIQEIKFSDPENLVIHSIENYIDFFTIFINEDKEEFSRLEKNKSLRLNEIKAGSEDSPYYLFAQAEINLQWALARLKFEEYFTAFQEVSKAYKQLNKNQKLYPDFIANKKSLGIMHAMIGTVPDNYRWGLKFLGGLEGTIEQGRKEIKEVLAYAQSNDFLFEDETVVMYAYLMLHLENQQEEAWTIIQNSRLNPTTNPLACFTIANIAMRTGRNDKAIQILEQRPTTSNYHTFHYLDYMYGLTKLYRLDIDADEYLEKYINEYRGQNYLKEAHQKLAWHYLLQGNYIAYTNNMRYCKIRGATVIDGDKTALREAEKEQVPNVDLLKSRLLFDGGYYQKAYEVLSQKSISDFPNKRLQLEYNYRLGRITHKLDQYDNALQYYKLTLEKGSEEAYFYACNAALQMGKIHEKQEQFKEAIFYYNQCLSLDPDEYKTGLHQQAKSGKNRLKKWNKP